MSRTRGLPQQLGRSGHRQRQWRCVARKRLSRRHSWKERTTAGLASFAHLGCEWRAVAPLPNSISVTPSPGFLAIGRRRHLLDCVGCRGRNLPMATTSCATVRSDAAACSTTHQRTSSLVSPRVSRRVTHAVSQPSFIHRVRSQLVLLRSSSLDTPTTIAGPSTMRPVPRPSTGTTFSPAAVKSGRVRPGPPTWSGWRPSAFRLQQTKALCSARVAAFRQPSRAFWTCAWPTSSSEWDACASRALWDSGS
mmetsp:Transcript_727/g.1919  ORF Transcript_727/g.1919 Transcript_727/m.1919 type:complete len:250 (-) Transcript_727:1009-1758(-)